MHSLHAPKPVCTRHLLASSGESRRQRMSSERRAMRAGHAPGEVMGGRKVRVARPPPTGNKKLPRPSWRRSSAHDSLGARCGRNMIVGVSTRKYRRVLDAVPPEVDDGTSKRAISRRFVAATKRQPSGYELIVDDDPGRLLRLRTDRAGKLL